MDSAFYKNNRLRIASIAKSPVVLTAHRAVQRSNDAAYAFEQEANFFYLTGVTEADWALVVDDTKSWLVAPTVDTIHQIFDGSTSWDDIKVTSGVDEIISKEQGDALIASFATTYKTVTTLGPDPRADHYNFALNPAPIALHKKLSKTFQNVKDCRKELAKMRAIKQPHEIEKMREAIALTVEAFELVKSQIENYEHEYEIESDFTHMFRVSGAKGHAYDPIVAAGKNACTLHYGHNQAGLVRDELILIDIGARVEGYAADITRTYSLGEATERQKAVHAAVEKAHNDIVSLLKPGLDVQDYHERVDEIMKDALKSLKLLHSDEDYRRYFPHAVSHGLGIDVHDSLGGPEVFLPGMVLTVEPGIYIPEEGIGVRIEDDILITTTGYENLSDRLPTSL